MKTHYGPKTHAHLLTECDGIAGQHGRPCLTGQKRQQQSYRALAYHKYEFIREDAGFVDRLQARVDGLDKRRFLKRHGILNSNNTALRNPRHDAHILSKAAAVWIEPRGEANLLVLGALRIEPPLAIKTGPAWYVMKTADSISDFPPADAGADSHYGSGDFMTEDLRRTNQPVPDFFHIGSADAASRHTDEHRSEEHTSELQSHHDLVCRLLLEKKKKKTKK